MVSITTITTEVEVYMDDFSDQELIEELEEHFFQMEKELFEQEVTSKSPDTRRPNLSEVTPETLQYG